VKIRHGGILSRIYNMGYKTAELVAKVVYLDRVHTIELRMWEKLYGKFDRGSYTRYELWGLPNECKGYSGIILKWAQDISPMPQRVLLAGEKRDVVGYLRFLGEEICTAGLSEADYKWNFENDPPQQMGKFDLIISQAILEHLLNPYKHLAALANLTITGGHLIIYGAKSGFPYHRFPIDACRFYPDWFEEMAQRLNLSIIKKHIGIFYMFQKR